MSNETPELSIVIPVFNEQDSITDLVAAIRSALAPMADNYELLFVDDGSADGTLDALKTYAAADPRVGVLSFRRNLGKSPALTCGFQHARGRYIVTMDADLQDDPRDIAKMHEYIRRERVAIVIGWRRDRQDSLLKVISSKLFNQVVVRLLFGVSFHDMNCGLKLYEAEAARDLRLYGGMHRFIPVIASEMGYRVAELPVQHHERRHGTSKYPSTKIFTELPDLLTLFFLMKYTKRPLHFFARAGALIGSVGMVALTYLTWLWTRGIPIGTRPLLSFGVLMVMVGAQIIFTGLLADLIVNVAQSPRQEFPLKYSSGTSEQS